MGVIKAFYITTSLGEHQAYVAGSKVEGKVVFDLKRPELITQPITIVLSGKAHVQWTGSPSGQQDIYGHLVINRLHSDVQDIFSDMTVQLTQQLGAAASITEYLPAGKHEFPYTFKLPANIPSSYNDRHGYVKYQLTATFPTTKGERVRQTEIKVHEVVRIDSPELITPLSDSKEKTVGCLCCISGPIKLSGTIEKGGYACGDTVVVQVNHRYRTFTNVSTSLRRKATYHVRETGESHDDYRCIATAPPFNSSSTGPLGAKVGYLYIPNTVLSINFDILQVSYFVMIMLAFTPPLTHKLTLSIPITIGNGQMQASPNDRLSSLLSASLDPMSNTLPASNVMPSAPPWPVPAITSMAPLYL